MKASVSASRRVFWCSGNWLSGPRRKTAIPWTVAPVGYSTLGRRDGSRIQPGPGCRGPTAVVRTVAGRRLPDWADGRSLRMRCRSRAPVGVRGPARTWLMRLPIRLARIVKASSRTAARRASRSATCQYAALGTTPTLRVTSRRTTAPGPPEHASSRPA